MANEHPNSFESRRLVLDEKLRSLLGNGNVYFQPPETIRLKYPCIIYELSDGDTRYADNLGYLFARKYQVMHVHLDPDEDLMDEIRLGFQFSRFDRRYVADNLYHDVYTIYFK